MDDKYIVKKQSVMHPEDGYLSAHVGYLSLEAATELQKLIKSKGMCNTMIVKVEA